MKTTDKIVNNILLITATILIISGFYIVSLDLNESVLHSLIINICGTALIGTGLYHFNNILPDPRKQKVKRILNNKFVPMTLVIVEVVILIILK